MTTKPKPRSRPQENGTQPEPPTFAFELTADELRLILGFLTNIPIGAANAKYVAAVLQAKIEQHPALQEQ